MVEINTALATPTHLLAKDGTNPGTITPAQANTLLGTTGGSGGGLFSNGFRDVGTSGTITSADIGKLLDVSGSGITLTLVETSFTAGGHVGLVNSSATNAVTISAGTNGINRAGNDSYTLAPDELVLVVFKAGSDPMWRTGFADYLTLAANQRAALNSVGTAMEARGENTSASLDIIDPPADANYGGWRAPWPGTLDTVKHKIRAAGGSPTVQLKKNGSNMTGFTSGVVMAATEGSVTCGDAFVAGDYLVPRIAATSGLVADGDGRKGATITLNVTRTGA